MKALAALAVLALLLIPAAAAQGRISFYFRVTDCETGEPVAGATVIILNRPNRDSVVSITNSTGYALLNANPNLSYEYFVSMQGYRTRAGESVFYDGMVFSVCLFKATAGFWNIVAGITMWQGDIHAGGLGWAIIRLKNLESGTFNITELQIWAAGYDKPVTTIVIPEGFVLGKLVDRDLNITVAPPPDAPVGRLKAELRLRAVFTHDDGTRLGPATVPTDLNYIFIQPYRTFNFTVYDRWGLNNVPRARAVFTDTLTGATFFYEADAEGRIAVKRLPDRAYRLEVFYDSPYDGQTHDVYSRFEILVDLVRRGVVNTKLFEAHVNVKDLAGRRLNTSVALGDALSSSENGLAVFRNVPRGVYNVRAWWMGVESFEGSVRVDEPLVIGSPGGFLEAVAKVGDIVILPRDWEGKRLSMTFTARADPFNLTASGEEAITLSQLPPGAYEVSVSTYNSLLGRGVEVGRARFNMPDDHGVHELRLRIYDVTITLKASDGGLAPVEVLEFSGLRLKPSAGAVKLYNLTAGKYPVKAHYMGVVVLDEEAVVEGPEVSLTTGIFPLRLVLKTVEGEPLEDGLATVKVGAREVASRVKDGEAELGYLPRGTYALSVSLADEEVYASEVDVSKSPVEVSVGAGRPYVKVSDQGGRPLQVEVEVAGVGRLAATGGVARFGQVPLRDYPYRVIYMGVEVFSGTLRPGQPAEVAVRTASLTVRAVNELGSPLDAEISLSRAGKLIGRGLGPTTSFSDIPAGPYTLTVTYGPKQVSSQLRVESDRELTVTVPVALSLGPVHLSIQELSLPVMLVAVAAAVAVALKLIPSALRRGR